MEAGEATNELEEAAPEAWQSIMGSGAQTDTQISQRVGYRISNLFSLL